MLVIAYLTVAGCALCLGGVIDATNITYAVPKRRLRVRTGGRAQRTNMMLRRPYRASNDVKQWPNAVITYQIDSSLARFRSVIRAAMHQIESKTCIRFQGRQGERDYIYLANGRGCHSKVGRAGGRQMVSLGYGCHDLGSILHELCHAVGLYHEHMRYDRDQFLQIKWQNIAPSMYDQFEKIPITQYRPITRFDYNSIMIYGSKAFSRNGRETMIPRDPQAHIYESHYKQRLSQSDIININSLYSCD